MPSSGFMDPQVIFTLRVLSYLNWGTLHFGSNTWGFVDNSGFVGLGVWRRTTNLPTQEEAKSWHLEAVPAMTWNPVLSLEISGLQPGTPNHPALESAAGYVGTTLEPPGTLESTPGTLAATSCNLPILGAVNHVTLEARLNLKMANNVGYHR